MAGTDPLGIISVIAGGISAISFVVSAICWIRAASIKHPNLIELGVIGAMKSRRTGFGRIGALPLGTREQRGLPPSARLARAPSR